MLPGSSMSKQGRFRNFKKRLGKPFKKQSNLEKPSTKKRKLDEDEDNWYDALNYLSVNSDDEYVDAPEEPERKKVRYQTPSGNELEKNSEMSRQCRPMSSTSGKFQHSQGHSKGSRQISRQTNFSAASTFTPQKTYQFGEGGSNTASSSSSGADVAAGLKRSPTIYDPPPRQFPMTGYKDKGKFEKRKVKITLMTSWHLNTIEGLKKKLTNLQRARPDLIEAVKVLELPFSGLHYYTFTEDVDIMVLCHSIVNRRFSITNVTDSLYDEFLDYCNKKLGKERIVVIAHDFTQEKDEVRAVSMNTFKHTQWSTFEKAGLVMICGMMDKTPEIQEKDWNSLVKFLEHASKSSPANVDISQTMLLKKDTSDTKRKPNESEKDKKGSDIYSKSLGTSSIRSAGIVTRSRKPVIYICTSWGLYSVKGLKEKLQTLLKQSLSRYEIREQELPYSCLEDFKFPSEVDRTDAMILCHSVQNRGFSITGVQNSIYDEFLKYCNRVFGKGHVAVIVHDFDNKPEILKVHLETIHRSQPATYTLAGFVAVAGQLDVPNVQLSHDKSTSLETFVRGLR